MLAATILGSSLAFIDSTVVNVALPALQSAFDATLADVQWVVESYALTLAALLLTGGSLGRSSRPRARSLPAVCFSSPPRRRGAASPRQLVSSSRLAPCRVWAPRCSFRAACRSSVRRFPRQNAVER